MKFPSSLGACIDLLYKLNKERLGIEKQADKVKKQESELEAHILETFSKSDIDGARGKIASVGLNPTTVPNVKDWDKLYAYIVKNKAFDLLQRRVSSSAYRARLEAKKVVPGVESYIVNKLSLRKRK